MYAIRSYYVHPGLVETDMGGNFVKELVELGLVPDVETAVASTKSAHPSGYGEPSDIASAVLYLASDAARWVTGAELVVDGGFTAA